MSRLPAAIVFDFDGVIADTERLHLDAMRAALRGFSSPDHQITRSPDTSLELSTEEYYARYLGFDDEGVFRLLMADRGIDPGDDRIRELVAEKSRGYDTLVENAESILYPGAEACIRRFYGTVPLAIASGAYAHEIRDILRPAGLLSCFQTLVGCGDTPGGKPAADPYIEAAHRLDVDPHRCIAIEDSRWGIQSAVAAGMTCIAVTTNYQAHELPGAVVVVAGLDDVTMELVERLS
ncbi:MAG: HAD family phosphatase [Vicinamibacterales bacterium]